MQSVLAYNVCGGSETSLRDVIHISEELVGRRLKVENDARPVGDVQRTAGDTTLIHRDLGWTPSTTLSEGLAAQIGWLQDPMNFARSSEDPSAWRRSSRQRDGRSRRSLAASSLRQRIKSAGLRSSVSLRRSLN
jgi:dTDP-D-glucose 4,6-dehydratase